jgi:hypothetical protein
MSKNKQKIEEEIKTIDKFYERLMNKINDDDYFNEKNLQTLYNGFMDIIDLQRREIKELANGQKMIADMYENQIETLNKINEEQKESLKELTITIQDLQKECISINDVAAIIDNYIDEVGGCDDAKIDKEEKH